MTAHPAAIPASEFQRTQPASERAMVLVGAALVATLLLIFAAVIGRRWRTAPTRKGIVLPEDVDALVWREEKGAKNVGRLI